MRADSTGNSSSEKCWRSTPPPALEAPPASHSRPDYLQRACDILLSAGKDPATVCGTVRNIGRAGEAAALLTLGELRDTQVDMFTTVFVGNSQTKVIGGKMVTPRGYLQRGE